MAITTPSMGLKRWDQPNDVFSYVELSNNFAAIDQHDHSAGKGVQIPTAGIANLAIDSTKIANDAVTNLKIPAASITSDRLVNSTVADTKLASPNNSIYRTLFQYGGGAVGLGTTLVGFKIDGLGYTSGSGGTSSSIAMYNIIGSSLTVPNKTAKMRLFGALATNGIAPNSSVTMGLSYITATAGTSGNISVTFGAQQAGTTVTLNTPAANSRYAMISPDFNVPADGFVIMTVVANVASTSGSYLSFNAALQLRHV